MNQPPETRLSPKILRKIGQNIRTQREQRGWSQEALAEKAGLHDRTVGKAERGKMNFSVLILLRLSAALDCSPNRLLDV